jgi:glycosyltransferase involved in cell wall biosynthesis
MWGPPFMLLSLIIPVYNEELGIPMLLDALSSVLSRTGCGYEILFVNDGSTDRTLEVLAERAWRDPAIKVISFGRNFGHQTAITAGLDLADGDAVIIMDADLQDPPELIPEMVRLFREGYDIVTPQRISRRSDSLMKRLTAHAFYKIMRTFVDRRMLPEVGDFRLLSAGAVRVIRSMRECHRFMRGMVASLGLREVTVPFDRGKRVAGETKYPFRKMLLFSWTAITSFSGLPLRMTLCFGLSIVGLGCIYLTWVLYAALIKHEVVPGWTSLVVLQCLFSGSILISMGLLGDYVGRIYEEAKARPLYIVDSMLNMPVQRRDIPGAVIIDRDMAHAAIGRYRKGSNAG